MLLFGEATDIHRGTIGFKAEPLEYDETVPVTVTGAYHERWDRLKVDTHGHPPANFPSNSSRWWSGSVTRTMKEQI